MAAGGILEALVGQYRHHGPIQRVIDGFLVVDGLA
jgi:hypothetical protein